MKLSGVILAGGESRRMGSDKAWLNLNGQPLIACAVATLRQLGLQQVLISGRPDQDYAALGCPVLLDRQPSFGPLGGIERALAVATSSLLLVLAVDLPRMTPEFLRKLAGTCNDSTGAVPFLGNRVEPLAAIYPKRSHSLLLDLIERAQYAACEFAQACERAGFVHTYSVPASDAVCFANWNSKEDVLNDRRSKFGQRGSAALPHLP